VPARRHFVWVIVYNGLIKFIYSNMQCYWFILLENIANNIDVDEKLRKVIFLFLVLVKFTVGRGCMACTDEGRDKDGG
jgi:hypothetical protein